MGCECYEALSDRVAALQHQRCRTTFPDMHTVNKWWVPLERVVILAVCVQSVDFFNIVQVPWGFLVDVASSRPKQPAKLYNEMIIYIFGASLVCVRTLMSHWSVLLICL